MSFIIDNLSIFKEGESPLFSPLSLQINSNEIVTLMGPSGSGKSTLLDTIAGHLSPEFRYTGTMTLAENRLDHLPAHQREVGILFQDDLLFPHLSVWQNLAFALPNHVKGKQRKQMALTALNEIDLGTLANSCPEQISGGQRARISLIRMLLAKPKLVLLDEPFSKLDKGLRVQFRDWVMVQLKLANIPALMVTHDMQDVPENSKVIILDVPSL